MVTELGLPHTFCRVLSREVESEKHLISAIQTLVLVQIWYVRVIALAQWQVLVLGPCHCHAELSNMILTV